jgi:hypothetical protein
VDEEEEACLEGAMSDLFRDHVSAREFIVGSLHSQATKEGVLLSGKENEVLSGTSQFDTPEEEMVFECKICALLEHAGGHDSERYRAACKLIAKQDDQLAFVVQEYLETSTRPGSLKDAWQLMLTAVIVVLILALLVGCILVISHFVFGWPS